MRTAFLKNKKFWRGLVMTGFLALIIIIFSQTINLTTSDLGRHLENGRIISAHHEILFSNYYSYTEPNNAFINHHWLAGFIYYKLFQVGGFNALTVLNILLVIAAFLLAFRLAKRRAGFYWPAFLSLPAILLLSERVEVRPEIFSYFFIFLLWSWLEAAKTEGRLKLLWLIPLLMVVWVNTHIYFFIGLILIGIYALAVFGESFWGSFAKPAGESSGRAVWLARFRFALRVSRVWWLALLGAAAASLLNPNTWRGLIYPFQIFKNYGYEIAENKTVFYLQNINLSFNYKIFEFFLGLSLVGLVVVIIKYRKNITSQVVGILAALFFILLGCFAVRNISHFGLAALVTVSFNLSALTTYPLLSVISFRVREFINKAVYLEIAILVLTAVAIIYFLVSPAGQNNFLKNDRGWGVKKEAQGSAEFFRQHNLRGPIFNNYDIGSALIFWLGDREKVFVDNRPEAYSASFFTDIYKPLQTDETAWQTAQKKYGFQTIYFAYTDSTPWAQQFMARILADPSWSLVYFDSSTIILVPESFVTDQSTVAPPLTKIDFWQFRSSLRQQALAASLAEKFNLASLAALNGQSDLAVEIYQEILFKYPNNIRALVSLSASYSSREDSASLNTALYYLNRAHRAGYRLPDYYDQQGLIYWYLSQTDQAVSSWQKALRQNKKDVDALYYLDQVKQLEASGELSRPK